MWLLVSLGRGRTSTWHEELGLMMTVLPPLRDEERTPDAEGGILGCECSVCRELRLEDDDRIVFTARDLLRAWSEGFRSGVTARLRHAEDES